MKTFRQQIEHKLTLNIPDEVIVRNPMLRKSYSREQILAEIEIVKNEN